MEDTHTLEFKGIFEIILTFLDYRPAGQSETLVCAHIHTNGQEFQCSLISSSPLICSNQGKIQIFLDPVCSFSFILLRMLSCQVTYWSSGKSTIISNTLALVGCCPHVFSHPFFLLFLWHEIVNLEGSKSCDKKQFAKSIQYWSFKAQALELGQLWLKPAFALDFSYCTIFLSFNFIIIIYRKYRNWRIVVMMKWKQYTQRT